MKSLALAVSVSALVAGTTAFAQYPQDPGVPPDATNPDLTDRRAADTRDLRDARDRRDYGRRDRAMGEPRLASRIGLTAEAGGGVGGFMDSRAVSVTQPQGVWTARLGIGSRSHVGAEVAYQGSAQDIDTLGISPNAVLLGNGVEGNLRLNLLTGMIQPYAIAGVGWTHYSLMGTSFNTSDVVDQTDVAQFPLGGGVAFRYNGFVADARLAFHPSANTNLIPGVNLSTWDVGGRLGFEF